jgi:hypothetical protein
MKTGPNAHETAENESGSAKHENGTRRPPHCRKRVRERKTIKRDPTPSLPPKMSTDAQKKKKGPNALDIAENEFGSQKIKTGADALGIAENESASAKKENGIRRPPHHWKTSPVAQNGNRRPRYR